MFLINLVILNPPPIPMTCDPPSIRSGGNRQEVCIHENEVWKRTYSCMPFGLWRREGYPTGDNGDKYELKEAKRIFGKHRDDYIKCLTETTFQNDSNRRMMQYESEVLVKPRVEGGILKFQKTDNSGSVGKNLKFSPVETIHSYESNLSSLLSLDTEIGLRNEWFFGNHYDDTYMTGEGEIRIIDCNITGKRVGWLYWFINFCADASNFWGHGSWGKKIHPGTASTKHTTVCPDKSSLDCPDGSQVPMEAFDNILAKKGSSNSRISKFLLRYTKEDVETFKKGLRFKPQARYIKKRIESLLERGSLERSEDGYNMYNYWA
ncbi:hypothetical protein TrVE_jg3691 [Triparma verrucosa]|uniref:Uncharacterized protein n=1 Tax=Triparma verrucosa TaxID=1606542 RepID=A0A9W7DSQ3_9STRA|nr:hypothetical protein TrVE_jg3691 [Triparma verrucosa]